MMRFFFLLLSITTTLARECDTEIGTFTATQVQSLIRQFVAPLVAPEFLESTSRALYLPAQHNVQVRKMCTSCNIADQYIIANSIDLPGQYNIYCNQSGYAYRQTQSALVFLPVDDNGDVIAQTRLRTFINFGDLAIDILDTPSLDFPASVENWITNVDTKTTNLQNELIQYLPSMLAASSGAVGLLPDYFGYGESGNQNRTYFDLTSIERLTATHMLRLREYLQNLPNCTRLDDLVTLRSVGSGATAGLVASDTLRRFGIRTLTNFVSGLLNPQILMMDILQAAQSNTTFPGPYTRLLPLLAYHFSSELPELANTGTDQVLVDSMYSNVVQAMQAPDSSGFGVLQSLLPTGAADLVDSGFRALFENAESDPCNAQLTGNSAGEYRQLCRALMEGSVWPLLDGSDRSVVYNHSLCYSPDDEVYTRRQIPPQVLDHPRISEYTGPIGFPQLAPTGGYGKARQLCTLAPMLYFNLQGHVPAIWEDRPHYMAPLTSEERDECGLGPPPTMAPVDGGNGGNGGGSGGSGGMEGTGGTGGSADGDMTPTSSPLDVDDPDSSGANPRLLPTAFLLAILSLLV